MFPTGHTVYFRRIPELPGDWPGRCGRHVRWDSRNEQYLHHRKRLWSSQQDRLWDRKIPILNQGQVGSCTGNEQTGVLGTAPFFGTLEAAIQSSLNEQFAQQIYSQAETIDGDGPYPPNDNGSSGGSAAQAAKNDGYISGYTHAVDVSAMVDALQDGPVGVGVNWYTSFDSPQANTGLVEIAPGATVRGGHEFLVRGCKVAEQVFLADNSWGTSFGINGSFEFSFNTMDTLFGEQGDCTVCVPLSQPAPTPTPGPANLDALLWYGGAGQALPNGLKGWAEENRTRADLQEVQRDVRAWARAKGLQL